MNLKRFEKERNKMYKNLQKVADECELILLEVTVKSRPKIKLTNHLVRSN